MKWSHHKSGWVCQWMHNIDEGGFLSFIQEVSVMNVNLVLLSLIKSLNSSYVRRNIFGWNGTWKKVIINWVIYNSHILKRRKTPKHNWPWTAWNLECYVRARGTCSYFSETAKKWLVQKHMHYTKSNWETGQISKKKIQEIWNMHIMVKITWNP